MKQFMKNKLEEIEVVAGKREKKKKKKRHKSSMTYATTFLKGSFFQKYAVPEYN